MRKTGRWTVEVGKWTSQESAGEGREPPALPRVSYQVDRARGPSAPRRRKLELHGHPAFSPSVGPAPTELPEPAQALPEHT